MSGIVGIINLDGVQVSPLLLTRLTDFIAFRGPDRQATWSNGPVGFGHALLQTTDQAQFERQPLTLNGQVWIVADARVDQRPALLAALKLTSQLDLNTVTDAELILRAYQQWDTDCVQHLLGDFAFAIWDERHQRLFCARDHFGVKPFYYAMIGRSFIFSNTLNCLRQHPLVSNRINERALADQLLFTVNYNLETTAFADVQRLPPAHSLTLAATAGLRKQAYWALTLPDKLLRYRHADDYIEKFKELLEASIADRLRTKKVAIFLSGGLDSSNMAASAVDVAAHRGLSLDLQAFTTVYDWLIPDQERYYSGMVAEAFGLPVHYQVADNYKPYAHFEQPELQTPELDSYAFHQLQYDCYADVVTHSRVVLYGEGPDEALVGEGAILAQFKELPAGDVLTDAIRTWQLLHIRPGIGLNLQGRIRSWLGRVKSPNPDLNAQYPTWFNPDFEKQYDLPGRWREVMAADVKSPHDRLRSKAARKMVSPYYTAMNEWNDYWASQQAVEVRLPYLDLPLVSFMLALPPLPWCSYKGISRLALRGRVPEAIWKRQKSPLAGDPLYSWLMRGEKLPLLNLANPAEFSKYVHIDKYVATLSYHQLEVWRVEAALQPIELSYWLQQVVQFPTSV